MNRTDVKGEDQMRRLWKEDGEETREAKGEGGVQGIQP